MPEIMLKLKEILYGKLSVLPEVYISSKITKGVRPITNCANSITSGKMAITSCATSGKRKITQ